LVAYDLADGRERFSLPAGMISADERWFVAAEPGLFNMQATVYDLTTGKRTASFGVRERELSGLSPTGEWAVFTRAAPGSAAGEWTTQVDIVSMQSGTPTQRLALAGRFEFDAFSADGQSLFLIEHLPAEAPDYYVIRLYDLLTQSLHPDPVRLKGSDEVMAGYAWEGKPTADGRWLLTLYVNTRENEAFIHALNLVDKYSVCLDLPSEGGLAGERIAQLKYYTLTPGSDSEHVYAANPALGVVADYSLTDFELKRADTFAPQTGVSLLADPVQGLASSRLAPDGRTLYFTNGRDIWAYDTQGRVVSDPFAVKAPIAGLAFSRDGRQLFAATADGQVQAFPAAR
jgi:hypothetical protein